MSPVPAEMVGLINVTELFSTIAESKDVLSVGVTPVISTKDGEKSSSNSNCPKSISLSIPMEIEPWLYAYPFPLLIDAVARIISL